MLIRYILFFIVLMLLTCRSVTIPKYTVTTYYGRGKNGVPIQYISFRLLDSSP